MNVFVIFQCHSAEQKHVVKCLTIYVPAMLNVLNSVVCLVHGLH